MTSLYSRVREIARSVRTGARESGFRNEKGDPQAAFSLYRPRRGLSLGAGRGPQEPRPLRMRSTRSWAAASASWAAAMEYSKSDD